MAGTLRKRCEKCGWIGLVRPRVRRCKQRSGMLGTYACWGHLVAAPVVRRMIEKPATDDRLERRLAAAHAALDNSVKELKRVTKRITEHQRRIKRLERMIDKRDHPDRDEQPIREILLT